MPFTETLASIARPLCSGTEDQTYSLLPKATTPDEATPSSVQCSEAHSSSGQPDYRTQNGEPPTTYSYRRRSRVGGGENTRQSLAPEKIPVPHQVERIWLQTQLLGVCFRSLRTRTHSRVPSQTPWSSATRPTCGIRQHLSLRVHCSET